MPLSSKANERIRVADSKPGYPLGSPKGGHIGHCIRCARPVDMNPARPLCDSCYDSWSQWENEDYEDGVEIARHGGRVCAGEKG